MSDEETPAGDDPGTDNEDQGEQKARHDETRRARGRWLLLLVLALAGIGAGYYWIETTHKASLEGLATRIKTLESALDEMHARLADNTDLLAAAGERDSALEARITPLRAAQSDLESSLKALYAKQSHDPLDWVLAEVEYLVLAATQRLSLEHDVFTAVAALKAADYRVREANHPELLPLREQLADDIAALEAVKLPDIEGLAIYLANTVTAVEKLPTKPIAELDMPLSRMGEVRAAGQDWQSQLRALWADIRSLVEIKDGELEDGVLFDPELRYFLQQNLRLELSSARLSVLRHDNANFRAAVTLVSDLLTTYYDTENGRVSAILTRLKDSENLELAPSIPSAAGSLDAIRNKRDEIRGSATGTE